MLNNDDNRDPIRLVFICDEVFLSKTCTSILSVVTSKSTRSTYEIAVILVDFSADFHAENQLTSIDALNRDDVRIIPIHISIKDLKSIHTGKDESILSASTAALAKFLLPELLNEWDKVLYLDSDMIVRQDLSELWNTDIEDYYAGAVIDSGSIYYKHAYVKRVAKYFNSGLLLLNLAKMRRQSISEQLIKTKRDQEDSLLMDQDAFNVVFDGRFLPLPIKWNFPLVSLYAAAGAYTIEQINETYGVNYRHYDDIFNDAAILHYSARAKPWKQFDVVGSQEWLGYETTVLEDSQQTINPERSDTSKESVDVSVIIPVFNTAAYLSDAINSILNQTLRSIEIICIDDGSTDESANILDSFAERDSRLTAIHGPNRGQSVARNIGLKRAKGKYVYFFDSDDLLEKTALEKLFAFSEQNNLDIALFDGKTFFESEELREQFPGFLSRYTRKNTYPEKCLGSAMFCLMREGGDYNMSPCLQLISRSLICGNNITFYEGIVHEDNIFSLQVLTLASNAGYMPESFFLRRVRAGSTMTSRTTQKDFTSFFVCAVAIYAFILKNESLPPCTKRYCRDIALEFEKQAAALSCSLDDPKKHIPIFREHEEIKIASILSDCLGPISQGIKYREYVEGRHARIRKVVQALEARKPGRAILYIPKKLLHLLRRWRAQ